jgi:N-carbamoylputrescine amidase
MVQKRIVPQNALSDDPHFMKIYFTPGDLGFKTTQTKRKNRNLNLLGWYPEAARLTVSIS